MEEKYMFYRLKILIKRSTELVKKSDELFEWKKSTTYTVLKRLCEKGIFENNKCKLSSS